MSHRVESCKEFVKEESVIVMSLTEWRAARILLGEL